MARSWILGVGIMLLAAASSQAGEGHGGHSGGCGVCCPIVKVENVGDYCWEVRSKEICIPPVQFPWQKTCGCGKGKGDGCCPEPSHHCGKIRCVKFLWQKPLKKAECVYEWNVVYPGKGKCDAPQEEVIPVNTDGDIPAPPPIATAPAPSNARVRLLHR